MVNLININYTYCLKFVIRALPHSLNQENGFKTSILSNILMLNQHCCPLSYPPAAWSSLTKSFFVNLIFLFDEMTSLVSDWVIFLWASLTQDQVIHCNIIHNCVFNLVLVLFFRFGCDFLPKIHVRNPQYSFCSMFHSCMLDSLSLLCCRPFNFFVSIILSSSSKHIEIFSCTYASFPMVSSYVPSCVRLILRYRMYFSCRTWTVHYPSSKIISYYKPHHLSSEYY